MFLWALLCSHPDNRRESQVEKGSGCRRGQAARPLGKMLMNVRMLMNVIWQAVSGRRGASREMPNPKAYC